MKNLRSCRQQGIIIKLIHNYLTFYLLFLVGFDNCQNQPFFMCNGLNKGGLIQVFRFQAYYFRFQAYFFLKI